jgi:protein subunit release factor A
MHKEKTEKLKDLKKEYKELQIVMNRYEKLEVEVKESADKKPFEDSEELRLLHLIQKEMDSTEKQMKEIADKIKAM